MHQNMRRFAIRVAHITITIINKENDLLYLLSISSSLCRKLTMDTSVMGGNFLRMKLDFIFVGFVNLKLNINLNVNEGLDKFIKGYDWYHYRVMDTLDVNELKVIIKSGVNTEHPSGMDIKASGGLKNLLAV